MEDNNMKKNYISPMTGTLGMFTQQMLATSMKVDNENTKTFDQSLGRSDSFWDETK